LVQIWAGGIYHRWNQSKDMYPFKSMDRSSKHKRRLRNYIIQ
jgi:hypothetical protein